MLGTQVQIDHNCFKTIVFFFYTQASANHVVRVSLIDVLGHLFYLCIYNGKLYALRDSQERDSLGEFPLKRQRGEGSLSHHR